MLLFECGVLALVLSSCGEKQEPPLPTATPSRLERDEGDEQPISVAVRVRLTRDATRLAPVTVAAFLPLRFVVDSDVGGAVRIAGVGRRAVKAEERTVLRSPGLKAGRVRVTGPGGAGVLRVRSGG